MKAKLCILVLVFLFGSLTVYSQEPVPTVPNGSVWSVESDTFLINKTTNNGLVAPNQTGPNGWVEAHAGLSWQSFPLSTITGTAISKFVSGTGFLNVCAQVHEMKRNSVSWGGTGQNCSMLAVGQEIRADHKHWTSWANAYWEVRSWHQFARTNYYWAPMVYSSANL